MKLPRDLSGADLARALAKVGYRVTRQSGSHVRLSADMPTQHHITIPVHDPLKVGTLAAVLGEVAVNLRWIATSSCDGYSPEITSTSASAGL